MFVRPANLPRNFPHAVTHEGVRFYWTGKTGTVKTGAASAEYSDDEDNRVWRESDGTITTD